MTDTKTKTVKAKTMEELNEKINAEMEKGREDDLHVGHIDKTEIKNKKNEVTGYEAELTFGKVSR